MDESVAADHRQVPEFELRVSEVFFLGLLVLADDVGVGDPDLEVDGIGDGIMRLPGARGTLVAVGLHPGLQFELFVVPALLLLPLHSLHLLGLHRVDLEARDLSVVVPLLFLFPRLLPVLLLHLVLQEAAKHVALLIDPHDSLLLLLVHPLLVALDLPPLVLCPLRLPLPVADCRLVLVDALQLLLVFYEMVVVLLVD